MQSIQDHFDSTDLFVVVWVMCEIIIAKDLLAMLSLLGHSHLIRDGITFVLLVVTVPNMKTNKERLVTSLESKLSLNFCLSSTSLHGGVYKKPPCQRIQATPDIFANMHILEKHISIISGITV